MSSVICLKLCKSVLLWFGTLFNTLKNVFFFEDCLYVMKFVEHYVVICLYFIYKNIEILCWYLIPIETYLSKIWLFITFEYCC